MASVSPPKPQQAKLIFYHIPADGDEADTPNAYPVLKPGGAPTVREVRAKFPLPGTYHFRFKMKWGDAASSAVWMDVPNEDSQVPTYDGKIVAKVTRVSWEVSAQTATAAVRTAAAAPSSSASASVAGVNAAPCQAVRPPPPPPAPQDVLSFDDDAFGSRAASGGPGAATKPQLQGALGCMQDLPAQPNGKQDDFDMLFS